MSDLWNRWHEFSKQGGLDTAGCQILADWKKEADQLRARVQKLEAVLFDIEKRCASLERDALECDKTVCHAGYIRNVIAVAYPQFTRKGGGADG